MYVGTALQVAAHDILGIERRRKKSWISDATSHLHMKKPKPKVKGIGLKNTVEV